MVGGLSEVHDIGVVYESKYFDPDHVFEIVLVIASSYNCYL